MAKLLGYSFTIEYKRGRENKVADALSWKWEFEEEEESVAALITFPTTDWIEELKSSYVANPEMADLMLKLESKLEVLKGFTMQHGIIMRKWRIVIVDSSSFKE